MVLVGGLKQITLQDKILSFSSYQYGLAPLYLSSRSKYFPRMSVMSLLFTKGEVYHVLSQTNNVRRGCLFIRKVKG